MARALVFAPLVLAGCVTDRPDPKRPDPLTGLPKRIAPSDRAVSSTYNPPDNTKSAAIAASGPRPVEGTSGLSIRDSKGSDTAATQPSGAWTGSESRTGSPNGAKLASAASSSNAGSTTTQIRTFEEGQQLLIAHGVKWQDLQMTGDNGWKFSCSVANKAKSTSVQTYEATDRYGLVAMQKVIDQIVREQQAR